MKTVTVNSPIYRNNELWVESGSYAVVRVFDKTRLIIRLDEETITLVKKVLTDWKGK